MKTAYLPTKLLLVGILSAEFSGCSGSSDAGSVSAGGATNSGGAASTSGGSATGGIMGSGGVTSGGVAASGGIPATGVSKATGGASAASGSGGIPATGGSKATGGATTGGASSAATGGSKATGGASSAATGGKGGAGTGGAPVGTGGLTGSDAGTPCSMGPWPAADPSVAGPFATVTENNVGPEAGVGVDGGTPPQFTLFRPKDMAQGGLCHPVITWGNGTGSTPSLYKVLLNQLASHGFVVIASNSTNVAQGTPLPMVAGVTWVLEQNADPTSVMYQRIDTTHVGATGHSQGGFATTAAGADSHITTIAPICGASRQTNLHGPAILFCGGNDTTVPCSNIQTAFNGITNQPVMLADFLAADHVSWVTFRTGTAISPIEVAVTAWMRVQLMGDTALRPRFYTATCTLCQDAAWTIQQKMMDQ